MKFLYLLFAAFVSITLCSCTVVKVVDTAASAAVGVTKGAVKTTGKVVGAAIPDGDKDKKKDDDEDEDDE